MYNLKAFIPKHILNMHAYTPGLQLNTKIIKLNTNENPYPLPDFILEEIQKIVVESQFHLYPNPKSENLRNKLAEIYKKNQNNILIGNGSDDVISIVFRTFLQPNDKILILEPSYSLYPVLANALNVETIRVPLKKDFTVDMEHLIDFNKKFNPKLVVITNPNAPTGIALTKKEILELYKELNKPLLIDEAYVFFGAESIMEEAGSDKFPLLMACSTFSKAFALAGLRLGWLIAHPEWIEEFDKIRDSYNVNLFTQKVGEIVLTKWDYFMRNIENIVRTRDNFIQKLNKINFYTLPSKANFIFTSPPDKKAKELYEYLYKNHILVRFFKDYPEFLRISIGTEKQMEILYDEFHKRFG